MRVLSDTACRPGPSTRRLQRRPRLPADTHQSAGGRHRALCCTRASLRPPSEAAAPLPAEREDPPSALRLSEGEPAGSSCGAAEQRRQRRPPPWQRRLRLLTGALPLGAGLQAWFTGGLPQLGQYGSLAESVGILAAIVFIHELGHFTVARSQGILVSEFSIGFGPAVISRKVKGVAYSLRAVPFGGFVSFPDDELDAGIDAADPNLMKNRSVPERFAVISAGVLANIAFAFAVLFGQATTVGVPSGTFLPGVYVPSVQAGSPAEAAGLRGGDLITAIDGETVPADLGAVQRLVGRIRESPDRQLPLRVQRGRPPTELELSARPAPTPEGIGRLGMALESNFSPRGGGGGGELLDLVPSQQWIDLSHLTKSLVATNAWEAASYAGREFVRLAEVVLTGFSRLFTDPEKAAAGFTGPLGVVAAGADVAKRDASGLCQFAAIVNLNLAIGNTLPLPGLDGGYMVLLALEAARGKKLDKGVEQSLLASGLLLLLTLGGFLVLRDTLQLTGLSLGSIQ